MTEVKLSIAKDVKLIDDPRRILAERYLAQAKEVEAELLDRLTKGSRTRATYGLADSYRLHLSNYLSYRPSRIRGKIENIVQDFSTISFLDSVYFNVKTQYNWAVKATISNLVTRSINGNAAFRLPPISIEVKVHNESRIITSIHTHTKNSGCFYNHVDGKETFRPHPHVQSYSSICFGDFARGITGAISKYQFKIAFALIKDYLTVFNDYDTAGQWYINLLIGDPNVELFHYNYMPSGTKFWSERLSRWGTFVRRQNHKTAGRFYISPTEYVTGSKSTLDLKERNVNPIGQLLPSLGSPMPSILSLLKLDHERYYHYPMAIYQDRAHKELKRRRAV